MRLSCFSLHSYSDIVLSNLEFLNLLVNLDIEEVLYSGLTIFTCRNLGDEVTGATFTLLVQPV